MTTAANDTDYPSKPTKDDPLCDCGKPRDSHIEGITHPFEARWYHDEDGHLVDLVEAPE